MSAGRSFFVLFSVMIALVGLFAAAAAHDYLYGFGLALFAFGVLFAFSCVKRQLEEAEGKSEP